MSDRREIPLWLWITWHSLTSLKLASTVALLGLIAALLTTLVGLQAQQTKALQEMQELATKAQNQTDQSARLARIEQNLATVVEAADTHERLSRKWLEANAADLEALKTHARVAACLSALTISWMDGMAPPEEVYQFFSERDPEECVPEGERGDGGIR